jgi:hypothetical protein
VRELDFEHPRLRPPVRDVNEELWS